MALGGFPRRFGSYVLLKPLARGGMGELDLAATGGRGMEKLCVIKRVLPHLLVADNVQRFREEATMMMRLSHGNLVGVLDAGSEEGQLYLAMDFVEGKDLLATWNQCATRQVAFPVEIAAYVIKELARGLAYAHAYRDLGLVHRDISPANVLLSYSGEVKLTDFGLAISKLKAQQTAPGIIYGKLAYLAPEQALGRALDGRTDLYAAGILLWEMLTGRQLFPSQPPDKASPARPTDRSSTLEALERVRHPVVTPPSAVTGRVPPDLSEIVMRALAVDPAERYQTGEELRADLASFLAKHAPATDAATLARFMANVFRNQIDTERADRDRLLAEASALLSGPIAAAGAPDVAVGAPTPPAPVKPRLVDPALWNSEPGARNAMLQAARPAPAPVPAQPASRDRGEVADPKAATGVIPRMPERSPFQPESVMARIRRRRQLDDRRASPDRAHALGEVSEMPYRVYGGLPAGNLLPSPLDRAAPSASGALESVPPAAPEAGDLAHPDPGHPAPSDDEDQRVGTTIAARYFVRRLCGEGAMGRVYEGHHIEIGRRVAIKVLHSSFRNTPDVVERFRREARAASRIGHPNIVDVTDSGTTPDGAFFFVMEYLDGVDLEQLLAREGPLPIERALLIAAQVCRALIAAHAAGIIHRDLKPANVMLVRHRDDEDFVKVLDFGISKHSDLDKDARGKEVGLTRPDAAVGTPIYMAPEQVAGQPADGRTDVYAVGELLFEMLAGVPPCGGGDIIAVFNKKANEDPVPVRSLRPEVPARIESLLTRAMSRAPADRHPSMTALKDEIMSGLSAIDEAPIPGGSPGASRPELSTTNARKWRPPAPAIWLTAGGVVAGLGLASMVLILRGDLRGGPRWDTPRSSPSLARPAPPELSGAQPTPAALRGGSTPSLDKTAPPVRPPVAGILAGVHAAGVDVSGPAHGPGSTRSDAVVGRLPILRGTTATRAAPTASSPRSASRHSTIALKRPAVAQTTVSAGSATSQVPSDDLVRGRAAFAKGNFPDAVRLGRAALTSGDAVGAHLLLGDAFYKMDRFRDALSEYDAVLKTAPTNPQAQRGRELALRRARP